MATTNGSWPGSVSEGDRRRPRPGGPRPGGSPGPVDTRPDGRGRPALPRRSASWSARSLTTLPKASTSMTAATAPARAVGPAPEPAAPGPSPRRPGWPRRPSRSSRPAPGAGRPTCAPGGGRGGRLVEPRRCRLVPHGQPDASAARRPTWAMADTLSRRALNRATLARQHLLERVAMPAEAMVEHLVGMQAQVPRNPYLALWSRLADFRAEELEALVAGRRAVRMGLMRSTLHLVTAADGLQLRPVMQPVLDRGVSPGGPFGRHLVGAGRRRGGRRRPGPGGGGAPDGSRAAPAAGRALARPRPGVAGGGGHVPAAGGAGPAPRPVAHEQPSDLDHDRGVAGPSPRRRHRPRRPDAPLPGRLRSRVGDGHAELVRPDPAAGGGRPPPARSSGSSTTRTAGSCSTCPTPPVPTRRRRRRPGSCPSTTTSCSATPTAPGSSARRTSPRRPRTG